MCPSKRKNWVYFIPPYFDKSVNTSSESYDRQYFYLKCCQLNKKTSYNHYNTTENRNCLYTITISLLLITKRRICP